MSDDHLLPLNDPDDWRSIAACKGVDTAIFFDNERIEEAHAYCGKCPVAFECAVAGKTEQGVWGGRDPQAMLCCHWCGRNFPRPPKGAPPKMCSKECRTDAHMDAKRRYARKVQQELPPLIEFCDVCGFEPAGPGGMASHRYAAHGLKGPLRRSA